MSKVNCPCGNQLSDVAVPTNDRAWMLTDAALDGLDDFVDQALLQMELSPIWRCDKCDRLALEDNKTRKLTWFRRETGATDGLKGALRDLLAANERTGRWADEAYADENWPRVVEQALTALNENGK